MEERPEEIDSYTHFLGEENDFVFAEKEYIALMTAAPLVVPALLMGAAARLIRYLLRS